jgi:hypothetical protein
MNKKIFSTIFPLFFVLAATRSIEQVKWLSYSAPLFYSFFLFFGFKELKNRELRYSLILAGIFGLWAMSTSLWSTYPRESLIRSIVFIVSSWSLIIGGFCWVKFFTANDFGFLLPLNISLLLASLLSLMFKIPADYWSGYGYGLKSFWGHQNILASMIVFTIPGILFLPLKNKRNKVLITAILLCLNIYILLMTHSRTSLAVLLICILVFILLSKYYKILGILILITIVTAIFYYGNKDFQSKLNSYLFKTEVSILDRKKPIITATYDAAGIGGWKGLGFGVSDNTVISNLQVNIHYHFEGVRLVREKGVSVLALIEETGWVGLTIFLFFVAYGFYLSIITFRNNGDHVAALMICLLFGMFLHAQLEGWWPGIGSVQFPLFMAVAGITIGRVDKMNND